MSQGARPARRPEDAEGWAVMDAGLAEARSRFGGRLEAAFAIGSLAHGGFAPAASDVDLALILSELDPRDVTLVREVGENVRKALSTPLANRLSVFWSTWESLQHGQGEGRFPLADRQDLAQSGLILSGKDERDRIALPPDDQMRRALVVEGARFMIERLMTAERDVRLRRPAELIALGCRDVTKAVLFPARFLCTAATGRAAGNEEAVSLMAQDVAGPAEALVRAAFDWRVSGRLGPDAEALLAAGLLPLYVRLAEVYAEALNGFGEGALADRMAEWPTRLEPGAAAAA
jgi:predicted nucleotidyltransferase